jgi:hypothetical protein
MAKMRSHKTRCKSEGEKKVFEFFQDNLSDDYIIWSNINLIAQSKDGTEEAEVDFPL